MADDVVPDRLAEELRREARRIGSSRLSDLALISADEVERLRGHWEGCQKLVHNAEEREWQEHCRANEAADAGRGPAWGAPGSRRRHGTGHCNHVLADVDS